jgi:putative ABC transport system permease protein
VPAARRRANVATDATALHAITLRRCALKPRGDVSFSSLIVRNLVRGSARTGLTVLAVAIAILTWVMLATVVEAWHVGADYAAKDRLMTRDRVSYGHPLPRRYVDDIAANIAGVRSVTYCDWFGGRWTKDPTQFFANLACADNAFDVYPELSLDPVALKTWQHDRQGAIIGDMLAKQLGLRLGDHITLQGSFYPGTWEFTIDGIYSAPARSAVDRSSFFFRWSYKNERLPTAQRDRVDWIFTRVDDPRSSAAISRKIDALFEADPIRTMTLSERAANGALLGSVSALIRALDLAATIVLAIMTLILGNTIAMGVRERAAEHALLRALGFRPLLVGGLIVAEALGLAAAGCLLGCALAYPLVQLSLGGWLEENMGQYFPAFRLSLPTLMAAAGAALGLAALAALLPARRIVRMQVHDALRRIA